MRPIAIRTIFLGGLALSLVLSGSLHAAPKSRVLEPMPDRPPSGGRIRLQTESWGSTWDWNQNPGTCPEDVLWTVNRGLYRPGAGGELQADLADSESASADSRIWTFRLKRGVFWSDGTPFVAQHVVDGILRAADPSAPSLPTSLLNLEGAAAYHSREPGAQVGIRALSDRMVEVRLIRPDPLFPLKWLDTRLMPARGDLAQLHSKSYGFEPEKMAFLGRMILADSRPGLRTLMLPNPRNPESAGLPRIELWHVPDSGQAMGLFDRGHIDLALGALEPSEGKSFSMPKPSLVALFPASARASERSSMLALSSALARALRDSPIAGLRTSGATPDWVPPETWKLQKMGDAPRIEPGPAPAFPGGKAPVLLQSSLDSTRMTEEIRSRIQKALGLRVRMANKGEKPDWVLRESVVPHGDLAAFLHSLDPSGQWQPWHELPLQDPKRVTLYAEQSRKALVEEPVLIPVGFGLRTVWIKRYLNPLRVIDATIDLAQLGYDPAALARPVSRTQSAPAKPSP